MQTAQTQDLADTRAYVKSVAMKYVRNETDAEDVTQDARGYIYADDDKWGIWILRDPNAN